MGATMDPARMLVASAAQEGLMRRVSRSLVRCPLQKTGFSR